VQESLKVVVGLLMEIKKTIVRFKNGKVKQWNLLRKKEEQMMVGNRSWPYTMQLVMFFMDISPQKFHYKRWKAM
jgi:hypothetical protein